MSDIKRFMAPGPWITRDLKECVLASDYDALQKSFEQECGDVDTLLALLQLNPNDYRSDAGWLLLHKIHAVIAARDAERDALRARVKALEDAREGEFNRYLEWRGLDPATVKPCKDCSGSGVKAYGSTATWRGGAGGQMVTTAVCDKCWGSGDPENKWPSWRNRT